MSDVVVQHAEVGAVARAWDEQQVRLTAAAHQVGAVGESTGFTPRVAPLAGVFCARWSEHVADLGRAAEVRADGLRDSLRDFLDSDASSALGAVRLLGLTEEHR
ncbi:MAG: hypothetical protein JWN84_1579 [Nocardioides sp.]|nr:hypothetical protein [Nocardioides sp.]